MHLSLGSSRFLRTIKARHQPVSNAGVSYATPLVVKVYIKHTFLSLKAIARKLRIERDLFQDVPNILPYQQLYESERAGYLVRQWLAASLYDRISTRPFLSVLEKKWIAWQLLSALNSAVERKVSHGDIKSENVLVTSSLWVYLTDFAPFKPTHLPLNDPEDFALYFDTSGRRTCYLAPERFTAPSTATTAPSSATTTTTTATTSTASKKVAMEDEQITEQMDLFSVGCVLAELFCDGVAPFTLAQFFKYRAGEYGNELVAYLKQIEDPGMMVCASPSLSTQNTRD